MATFRVSMLERRTPTSGARDKAKLADKIHRRRSGVIPFHYGEEARKPESHPLNNGA